LQKLLQKVYWHGFLLATVYVSVYCNFLHKLQLQSQKQHENFQTYNRGFFFKITKIGLVRLFH